MLLKTNPKEDMQPGAGSEGLMSHKWGARTGFNNQEVMGLQKSSFRGAGEATQPNRTGVKETGGKELCFKGKQEFEDKAGGRSGAKRNIVLATLFFFLMRETRACSDASWNNPEK